MRRLILAMALLAGCTAKLPGPGLSGYRDTSVQISSKAVFDPARFAGTWYEIARYPLSALSGCVASRADYSLRADGSLAVVNTCHDGGVNGPERRNGGSARLIGPGRLAVQFDSGPNLSGPYWVLWIDEGYRTAVVGMPSGRGGWILNRDPQIPLDRLTAAREVLEFNGYDLGRLVMVPQARR